MSQIKNILDGWRNAFLKDDEIEALARIRLDACENCPSSKENIIDLVICGSCGCPLLAKSRAPEDLCPRGRWGETLEELTTLREEETDRAVINELNGRIDKIQTDQKISTQ
mgnify:CR=1 FL=1|tara:strand:- start:12142 stop:12474 length:333 start_codon:yes stop_codon:yes gene_type:complete